MANIGIDVLDTTFQKTHEWINELMEDMREDNPQNAFSALSAVLHALRDNLTVQEAVDLGAQLPIVIRGVYYGGWRPAATPVRERSIDKFLERVDSELRNRRMAVDSHHATQCVFRLLSRKVSKGEIEDVISILPREIKDMWPQAA